MRHMRDLLVGAPSFGDVLDHVDEVTRLAGIVADPDPGRGDVAHPLGLALPGMFVLEQSLARLQRLAVIVGDDSGGGIRVYVEGSLANDVFTRLAELLFGGPVDQQILLRLSILHGDLRRDVVDDLAQEHVVAVAFLLQIAAFGDVFDRGHPSALREWGVDDLESAAARQVMASGGDRALRDDPHDVVAKCLDIAFERAALLSDDTSPRGYDS